MGDNKPQNTNDVREILAEQMYLIAQRSKEIISEKKNTEGEKQELYFLSSAMLEIGKYLNEKYFMNNNVTEK